MRGLFIRPRRLSLVHRLSTTTIYYLTMKAWQLLEDPKHWTKDAFARNKDGQEVDESSPDAVCWCVVGACRKLYTYEERKKIYDRLRPAVPYNVVMDWNDNNTHAIVLAKLKELDI